MKEALAALTALMIPESQAKTYLAALTLGPATAIEIAKKAGITRQMLYTLLPALLENGLLTEVTIGKKRYFEATDPTILTDIAQKHLETINDILPTLRKTRQVNPHVPIIKVHENPISMREWYRTFMNEASPSDELMLLVTNKLWMETDPSFLKEFVAFKNKVRTHDKIIAPDTRESRVYAGTMGQRNAQYRFLKQHWGQNAEKWIWRDTISYMSIHGKATNLIVIRSEELANMERRQFQQLWDSLE